MTNSIFKDWLEKWDAELTRARKKALLFVDNCASHNALPELVSLKVLFLPPNTTSKLQPMDLGIIKNFKVKYRVEVARYIIKNLEDGPEKVQLNVLEALRFIKKAWNLVTPETIANCFGACGFGQPVSDVNLLTDIHTDWSAVSDNFSIPDISFQEYVMVDFNVPTFHTPTDEEIVEEVKRGAIVAEEAEPEEPEDPAEEPVAIPTYKATKAAISTVRSFLEGHEGVGPEFFAYVDTLTDKIDKEGRVNFVQSKINDFFKKA